MSIRWFVDVAAARSIDTPIANGLTPLQMAVRTRNFNFVRDLIRQGANPDKTHHPDIPTAFELAKNDPELMAALVPTNADSIRACDQYNYTPLMYAAAVNDDRLIRMLLAAHVQVDATCGTSRNALTIAIAAHAHEALRLIAAAQPDYVRSLGDRMQAIDIARRAKNSPAIELLEHPTITAMKAVNVASRKKGLGQWRAVGRAKYEDIVGKPLPPLVINKGM